MADQNIRPVYACAYYKDWYLFSSNTWIAVRRLSPGIEMPNDVCPVKANINSFYDNIINSCLLKDKTIIDNEDKLFSIIKMFKSFDKWTIKFSKEINISNWEWIDFNIPITYAISWKYNVKYLHDILTCIPRKNIVSVEFITIFWDSKDTLYKPMIINISTGNVVYEFLLMPVK